MKLLFWSETYKNIADARYRKRRGIPQALECCARRTDAEAMKVNAALAIENELHGLRSIKRDFSGVPIVLAWQAVAEKEFPPLIGFSPEDYHKFYETVVTQTKGYVNDDWLYVDVHGAFFKNPHPAIGVHLGNEGQTMVAEMLADSMLSLVELVFGKRMNANKHQ